MFKNEDDFAKLVDKLDIDTEPSPSYREQLRQHMLSAFQNSVSQDSPQESKKQRSTWPGYRKRATEQHPSSSRRTLMSSKIAKFATAASVAAAIIVALTFVHTSPNGSGTAWAIEQTVTALEKVRTLHLKGIMVLPSHLPDYNEKYPIEFQIWCRGNDEGTQIRDGRFEQTITAPPRRLRGVTLHRGNEGYIYEPDKNRVVTCDANAIMALNTWPGPDFFRDLKEKSADWQETYGEDEQTGRPCVFVTCATDNKDGKGKYDLRNSYWIRMCGPCSYWFQFDLETKLPLRVKQWMNPDRKGEPVFTVEEIAYNIELSDDLFEFEIPEGATVIDMEEAKKQQSKERGKGCQNSTQSCPLTKEKKPCD